MKRMKKMSLLLALVLMVGVLLINAPEAQAAEVTGSGSCGDNLIWTLDNEGTLAISGSGNMTNHPWTWSPYTDAVKTVEIQNGVTNICARAFVGCGSLTSITIPDSVTSIGNEAFSKCTSLTNIVIPDSVSSIGEWAFDTCTNLLSVDLGNGVTSIGDYAFTNCTSLTSVTIPNGVTSIGNQLFGSCQNLTSVTIPDSVTSIGKSAFYLCNIMQSIAIPDSVTSIGDWAFYYCFDLEDVYYGGTEDQWAEISIGSNNGSLTNATIHYTEPEPEPEVTPLAIVNQPADQTVAYNETAQFTVEATGVASYAWQYSKNGTTWYATKLTGYDTAALSVPMTTNRNGYQYRCKLTGEDGILLYTDAVTLTMVEAKPECGWVSYDGNPIAGGTTFAQIYGAQNIASYQWQYCRSQADADAAEKEGKEGVWRATSLEGCNTDTLTIEGHPGREGYQYRCKLTGFDGTVVYTDSVTLSVESCITEQPQSQGVDVYEGFNAQAFFTVEAENAASYQWQYRKNDSAAWCVTKMNGYDCAVLNVDVNKYRDGYQYRCKLTLTDGTVVYTDIATLSVWDG